MAKPAAGPQPLHPYEPHTVDMLKAYGAKNGNTMLVTGRHTQVAAVDTIVTGLASVSVCGVSFGATGPTVKQLHCSATIGDQAGSPAAGSIYTKTWKPTSSTNDATPTAATDFSDNVVLNWWAIGTPAAGRDDPASANVNI